MGREELRLGNPFEQSVEFGLSVVVLRPERVLEWQPDQSRVAPARLHGVGYFLNRGEQRLVDSEDRRVLIGGHEPAPGPFQPSRPRSVPAIQQTRAGPGFGALAARADA